MLIKKRIILIFVFYFTVGGLFAQVPFPAGNFWTLDGGIGMTDMAVEGPSFQFIIEPKLWISRSLMTGAKFGFNYSIEDSGRNILTFDTLVFLRWNFIRFGKADNPVNVYMQGGIGLLSSYRGTLQEPGKILKDPKMTRGSVMAEAGLGLTIPLNERWHIEPTVRFGYPHIWGASLTAGYKFRLPQSRIVYNEVIKEIPPIEIVKRVMVTSVEYIIFNSDTGRYNIGIDRDAQALNELVLNSIAAFLKENPNCIVRIEGHANPVTSDLQEADELNVLSRQRSNAVADQLRQRGISDDQMVIFYYGGSKTVIPFSDTEHWNRNRRVELIVIQIE